MPSNSYSSSALHYYYPAPHHPPNYTHILSPSQKFQPQFPLPSASQSHIPSLRCTPSVPVNDNLRIAHASTHSFPDQRNNLNSRNSQHIHAPSPIVILDPQPLPQAPYHASSLIHIQPLPTSPTHSPRIHLPGPPRTVCTATAPLQQVQQHISSANSSLPSTKDVPLLTGKHDWGPWHSAVRTLILNANLLGHMNLFRVLPLIQVYGQHTHQLSLKGLLLSNSSLSMTGGLAMESLATSSLPVFRLLCWVVSLL